MFCTFECTCLSNKGAPEQLEAFCPGQVEMPNCRVLQRQGEMLAVVGKRSVPEPLQMRTSENFDSASFELHPIIWQPWKD